MASFNLVISERQAMFRPIRVDSPKEVTIVKMFVPNSICGFRESRKTYKYIVELATRAQDPVIRSLAVEVLNEYQKEIRAAQDDPENAELMKTLREDRDRLRGRMAQQAKEDASGASTTQGKTVDITIDNIINEKGERRKPELFGDIKWTDGGKRVEEAQPRQPTGEGDEDEEEEVEIETDFDPEFTVEDEEEEEDYEEYWEKLPTEKQRASMEAKAARENEPELTEEHRQLAFKLLEGYDRIWKEDDLDQDIHLNRALRLIHSKKLGLPFDEVPTPHIKYTHFPGKILQTIAKEEKLIKGKSKPLLMRLLAGNREKDCKPAKDKGKGKGIATDSKGKGSSKPLQGRDVQVRALAGRNGPVRAFAGRAVF